MADELFVSIVEAARRLGIGRTGVYDLIGDDMLRVVKVGARSLVAVSELGRCAAELSKSGGEPERPVSGEVEPSAGPYGTGWAEARGSAPSRRMSSNERCGNGIAFVDQTAEDPRACIVATLVELRNILDEVLAGEGTLWPVIAELALASATTTRLYLAARIDEEGS